MADAANKKTIYAPFAGAVEIVENVYDFSEDGGAVGDLDYFAFGESVLLLNAWIEVETTCTSSGSATVGLQVGGNAMMTAVAVASLVAGSAFAITQTSGPRHSGTSDIGLEINVEALTAGKIKVKCLIAKLG